MRPRRPNYSLPTESQAQLDGLFAGPISAFYVGLRQSAIDKKTSESGSLIGTGWGGPLFLYVEETKTSWILQADSHLDSLVVRKISCNPAASEFLEKLYQEDDYEPDYLRAKRIVDVTHEIAIDDRILIGGRVHKLPDNSNITYEDLASQAGVHTPNQCAIELVFKTGEVLIAYRMDESRSGHRFMTWDDVSSEFPMNELEVCLELRSLR